MSTMFQVDAEKQNHEMFYYKILYIKNIIYKILKTALLSN